MKTLNTIVADLEYCKEWKPIPGFEELYEVSNMGDVQSARRSGAKGGLRRIYDHRGYYRVSLSKNNKSKPYALHRLVAMAFIPNPENKPQVNHKDGNKGNNCVENLEWCTSAENYAHKMNVLGKDDKGSKNGNYGYGLKKYFPLNNLRNELSALGIPRHKQDIVSLENLLPHSITHIEKGRKRDYKVTLLYGCDKDQCWYRSDDEYCPCGCGDYFEGNFYGHEHARKIDNMASLIIYLLKNNIISLEEVNSKL